MKNVKYVIRVTCAIIRKGDLVLVTQRSEQMKMPLKWEFPGGKVERGESEERCLLRELKEELNIDVSIVRRLVPRPWNYPDFSILLIPFVVDFASGDIVLHEHQAYRWVSRKELSSMDWAEADVPVVEDFLRAGL